MTPNFPAPGVTHTPRATTPSEAGTPLRGGVNVRITDDTTRTELADALAYVNHEAKRAPHVLGTAEYPSKWDQRHAMLDALLTDYWDAPA